LSGAGSDASTDGLDVVGVELLGEGVAEDVGVACRDND
jgi:hypothetical protein